MGNAFKRGADGLSAILRAQIGGHAAVAGLFLGAALLLFSAWVCGVAGVVYWLSTLWGLGCALAVTGGALVGLAFALVLAARHRAERTRRQARESALAEFARFLSAMRPAAPANGATGPWAKVALAFLAGFLLVGMAGSGTDDHRPD